MKELFADYRSKEERSGSDSGGNPKNHNNRRNVRGGGIGGELAAFGESLKQSDMAPVDSEREQLQLEWHKFNEK